MATTARLEEGTATLPDGEVRYLRRAGAPGAGTLLLAHANGLNAGAFAAMIAALPEGRTVIAYDARGHGRTDLPADPRRLTRWDPYADDALALTEALGPEGPLLACGHSLGAVAMLLAVARGLPATQLLLIEPVLVPRAARLVARTPLRGPLIARRGLAARAARRKDDWPDARSARSAYAQTPFFAGWDEAALDGYLSRGLAKVPSGVRLSCAPAWEAATFAGQGHRFWGPLGRATGRVPVGVLKAQDGSTVPEADVPRLVRAGARVTRMAGSHMLPTERPRDVAAWVAMTADGEGV